MRDKHALPADPRLAALWQSTPTNERYWIDGEHHIAVNGRIIPLASAAKRQEIEAAA